MATQISKSSDFQELNPKQFLQSLFETSSVQKHPLGARRVLSDGREFIYAKAGAANIAIGVLCQGPTHALANSGNLAIANNANIGDKSINVTHANDAVTANLYAEGWLHINTPAANGAGYLYKIRGHAAGAANATITFHLYDALRANVHSAASKATVTRHVCSGVVIHPSPPTEPLVGVSVVAVTANYFAWFQRKGPAVVLANGTLVQGERAYASGAVDGAVSPSTANGNDMSKLVYVGTVIRENANGHYALIDLFLP